MMSNTFVARLSAQLTNAWNAIRSKGTGAWLLPAVTLLVCIYAGYAIQRQAQSSNKLSALNDSGTPHVQLNNWIAEYFSCSNGQCKRVLKQLSNGKYEVASESLPLGSGRYVSNSAFSTRPTHVKLSHKISDQENQWISKNWGKEKPVLALAGQPVCDQNKCKNEDFTIPLTKQTMAEKTWVQFDSHIDSTGHFGPQSIPPVIVAQGSAHHIFSLKSNFQRGLMFELALTLLAPLFVLGLTIWVGMPLIYSSFTQLLAARSMWSLFAADTFLGQSVIFQNINLRNSYALSAFFFGWVVAAFANFLCTLWMNRSVEQKRFNSLWAVSSVVALVCTYLFPAGSKGAQLFLRSIDTGVMFSGALFTGFALMSLNGTNANNRFSSLIKLHSQIEQTARWKEQLVGLTCGFAIAAVFGLWVVFQARSDTYAFHWGSLLMPVAMTCVLMYARPQLTPADVQTQKDFVTQQELLVKLLSQLGNFKHRAQAISLVVNFCNRELPKLGFEPPTFSEQQPIPISEEDAAVYEVSIEAQVKGPHQSFGWITARARKRSEYTAMGERIIEALTTTLAQHLDSLIRNGLLESEVTGAQKFIPRDILKLFSIINVTNLEANQDFSFPGTVVSILLKPSSKPRDGQEHQADRTLVNELSDLFNKRVTDQNGYVVHQEGMRWVIAFRDQSTAPLKWIENIQNAIRSWNQHRQGLGLPTQECTFGVHSSQLTLRFSENMGCYRAWISYDLQGISSTLAEVANDYSAAVLLSQDFVDSLSKGQAMNQLPDAVRPIDRVWNRSKTATVDIFEFFGGDSDLRRTAKQRTVELFTQGVRLYLTGYFDGAKSIMSQILESDPHDKAAQRLLSTLSQSEDLRAA